MNQIQELPSFEKLEAVRISSIKEHEELLRKACEIILYFGEPFKVRHWTGTFVRLEASDVVFKYHEWTTKFNVERDKPDTTIFLMINDPDGNYHARRTWRDPAPDLIDPADVVVIGDWMDTIEDLYVKMLDKQEQQTVEDDIEQRLELARRLQIAGGE